VLAQLSQMTRVCVLDFSHNNITESSAGFLGRCLQDMEQLCSLDLTGTDFWEMNPCEYTDEYQPRGAEVYGRKLGRQFRSTWALVEMRWQAGTNSLLSGMCIASLRDAWRWLTMLDLFDHELGQDAEIAWAALSCLDCLQELRLEGNVKDASELVGLGQALARLPELREVYLAELAKEEWPLDNLLALLRSLKPLRKLTQVEIRNWRKPSTLPLAARLRWVYATPALWHLQPALQLDEGLLRDDSLDDSENET
jgi:hypothetical protein